MTTAHEMTEHCQITFSPARLGASASCPSTITLRGDWGFRIHRNVRRLEDELPYCDEYLLGQVWPDEGVWSHFPRFHGDIVGRWIQGITWAHSADPQPPAQLRSTVEKLVALQNADGSFGRVQTDEEPCNMHRSFGNTWCLRGLATYARAFSCPKARAAAERLGDFVLATFPLWSQAGGDRDMHSYAVTRSCYFVGLDALIEMYRLTDDARYLDMARKFATLLTSMEEADHCHMYLTSRRGLLALAQVTGDAELLKGLVKELDVFHGRFGSECGGVPERMCLSAEDLRNPEREFPEEGCGLFDWLLICWELFEATGETRWRDRAILNLENAIAFNQHTNGGFGDQRIGPHYGCESKEAPWCCSCFGPFGLLAAACSLLTRLDEQSVELRHLVDMDSEFADGSRVSVTWNMKESILSIRATGAITTVQLNLPDWVQAPQHVRLSDAGTAEVPVQLHTWSAPRLRGPVKNTEKPADGSEGVCFHGPWLMAHRFNDPHFPTVFPEWDDAMRIGNARVESLAGLGFAGTGIRMRIPADNLVDSGDVCRGYDQGSGELWLYRLRDREVVWRQWTRLYFGSQS